MKMPRLPIRRPRRLLALVAQALSFDIAWPACVVGAAAGWLWLGPALAPLIVALHLALPFDRRQSVALILGVGAAGIAMDSLIGLSGILVWKAGAWQALPWFCPPWLLALWAVFPTNLNASMAFLQKNVWLSAAIGAAAGPLAYGAGVQLGVADFGHGRGIGLAVLALAWALFLPLAARYARHLAPKQPART